MSSGVLSAISCFDERQWVIYIRRTLDEELDENIEIPVSIFSIPKTLLACDPGSYIPHQVSIGPYHHARPEMHEMERYKLAAAKRMQQHLQNLKFDDVVEQLTKYESQIRACYHKCLTRDGETLAWMMAVDACFLLDFLQIYAPKDGEVFHRISSRMSHLVDITGRKSAHNAILRDMVMLENQIPLFILRKMLEIKFSSLEKADNLLFQMLMGFFYVLSPFKKMEDLPKVQAMECAHLLDFLYHLIVPKIEQRPIFPEKAESGDSTTEGKEGEKPNSQSSTCIIEQCPIFPEKAESGDSTTGGKEGEKPSSRSSTCIIQLLDQVWNILMQFNNGPVGILKKIFSSKIVMLLTKLPLTIISNFPGLKLLKGPLESLCFSQDKEKEEAESEDSTTNDDKPPLVEEIAIPSVSDLSKAYVNFVPTKSGILSIKFDEKTRTFYLPSISLDENSCVLLKNLVAYEACNASGPVIFTRYTELMNGIIDTEEDAKILREKGIIQNRLKSDEEVTKLWNGMNRCVRLTKAPHLDKVIGDVNKFYNGRLKVKLGKLLKAYVFGSWKFLTLLACVLLLLLMALQAFCSVYSCGRRFQLEVPQ